MSQGIDLKAADRKVFSASFDDGLVDIFIASFSLMFAVGPLTTTYLNAYLGGFWGDFLGTMMFLPFFGVVYLLLRWVRKRFVAPRSLKRKSRRRSSSASVNGSPARMRHSVSKTAAPATIARWRSGSRARRAALCVISSQIRAP